MNIPRRPWADGGKFDLPDEPTDKDLRRALRVLVMGGAIGGNALWHAACTRALNRIGPDEPRSADSVSRYERVEKILRDLQPPPSGVMGKAGRGLVDVARPLPHDYAAIDADAEEIRRNYGAFEGAIVLAFRRQLDELGGTDA